MTVRVGDLVSSHAAGVSYVREGSASDPTRSSTSYGLLDGMDITIGPTSNKSVLVAFSGSFRCGSAGWVACNIGPNSTSHFVGTEVFEHFTVAGPRTLSIVSFVPASDSQRTIGVYWKTNGATVVAEARRRALVVLRY